MTPSWDTEDWDLRLAFARLQSPTDFLTSTARFIVGTLTLVLRQVLMPVDKAIRLTWRVLMHVPFVFLVALATLMVLDLIWLLVWGMLMGSSWVWLRSPWARPLLILPGIPLAILAHIFVMVDPDPHKNPKYEVLPQVWPLSWYLWSPPPEYYEEGAGA